MSNPYRHLASTIVSACQTRDNAKRVKQSTVLDVLSKHAGQHSIQVGDTGGQKNVASADAPSADIIALRGLLYANLSISDLLPVELGDIIMRTTPLADDVSITGDRLFTAMWDTISLHGLAATDNFIQWVEACQTLEEGIELEDTQRQDDAMNALPELVRDFLRTEMKEVCDDDDDYALQQSSKIEVLSKFYRDVEHVIDALNLARTIQA